MVASRHLKSTIFRKGGSSLGHGFLSMLAQKEDTDCAAEFHTWVAAQAIQINRGCGVVVPKKRRIKPVGDITDQFRVGK